MPRNSLNGAVRRIVAGVLFAAIATTFVGLTSSPASADQATDEGAMFNATNTSRAQNGLGPLQYDAAASNVARAWVYQMAASGTLSHNPNLAQQITQQVTPNWTRIGENVGYGPSVDVLENAFMNSPAHKANILGDYNRLGVGSTRDSSGQLWVVLDFVKAEPIASTDPPGTVKNAAWYLRNAPAAGQPDSAFPYGVFGWNYVSGDWNGDGTQTIGVYTNGNWYLRNATSGGSPDLSFAYGAAGYQPVVGDWNGDGIDTIGVYYQGWWYLRNSNTPGSPDIVIHYGAPGYEPVVGDWNGDGISSIGVFVNGWWYLRNLNNAGSADYVVNYGAAGYQPVVGKWAGAKNDGIGVYVNGWWYLRNTVNNGAPNLAVNYGAPGYVPIAGRWAAGSPTGIGVIIPG
jgi:uncharacterized protein YkwD